MANPPVTIGPFQNTPAPGSPIRSDWAQEISTVVTSLIAQQTRTWTAFGIAGTSGGSFANIQSQNVPAQAVGGVLFCTSYLRIDMGTMTGDYTLDLRNNTTPFVTRRVMASTEASRVVHVTMTGILNLPVSTSANINLNGSGTANVTTYAVNATNRLDILFVPSAINPT